MNSLKNNKNWFEKYRESSFLIFGVLIGFGVVLVFFLIQDMQAEKFSGDILRTGMNIPNSIIPGPPRETAFSFRLNSETAVKLIGSDDAENERWLDISGNSYTGEFVQKFSYENKKTQVLVSVTDKSDTLRGRLEAQGLKPNFAYQIKLRGIYKHFESFEKIGYAGRWRLSGKGTNYSDADYREKKEKSDVEAYVLFDFFVTDKNGNAVRNFALDSSLHVLWNGSRQGESTNGEAVPFSVDSSDPKVYSRPKEKLNIESIWAERELGRYTKSDQKRFLPKGKYFAEIVLTEESFHSTDNDGGYWATVFKGKVEFTVE